MPAIAFPEAGASTASSRGGDPSLSLDDLCLQLPFLWSSTSIQGCLETRLSILSYPTGPLTLQMQNLTPLSSLGLWCLHPPVAQAVHSRVSPIISARELGRSLQASSALESQVCPPASLGDPSSLNPRPALSLPQPLARQPSSHLPACLTPGCPRTRCFLLPPGSGHILPVGRSAIASPFLCPSPASLPDPYLTGCQVLASDPQVPGATAIIEHFHHFSGQPVDLKHFLKQYGEGGGRGVQDGEHMYIHG
ncbi:uncharacterized protein LOC129555254 [Moschus berezovskii]|uniref:uncharacterized protein LOC129555254 n=1 Tax=Moschus berezovskii TaxID=68408 RepID=UPI0024452229|nr:uncharacterized protein LOC129555254 [Moschus berezovskii]